MAFDERQPLIEDDLRWKTTFDGRQPSMEDDLLPENDKIQSTTYKYRNVYTKIKNNNSAENDEPQHNYINNYAATALIQLYLNFQISKRKRC